MAFLFLSPFYRKVYPPCSSFCQHPLFCHLSALNLLTTFVFSTRFSSVFLFILLSLFTFIEAIFLAIFLSASLAHFFIYRNLVFNFTSLIALFISGLSSSSPFRLRSTFAFYRIRFIVCFVLMELVDLSNRILIFLLFGPLKNPSVFQYHLRPKFSRSFLS